MIDRDRLTCVGVIARAHGLKGELKVTPLTEDPAFYRATERMILELPTGLRVYQVAGSRAAAAGWILSLEGVADRPAAEALKGARLLLEENQLKPLGEGEFFQHDLVGCRVETLAGRAVGEVQAVMETGANDVLVVGGGVEVMIPMVAEVVKAVDIAARVIRIEPLPGLLEPDEPDETD